MVDIALRKFAKQNFGDGEYYPVYQGATHQIQVLALMAKGERSVFLRPFYKNKLTILAGLAAYVEESKRKEFQDALSRKIRKVNCDLVLAEHEDEDDDEEPGSDLEVEIELEKVANATIKINRELGRLELGKIDQESILDPELRALLAQTELDSNTIQPFKGRKLRLITSVVNSEYFRLGGRRRFQADVDAGVTIPMKAIFAKLKGHAKKTVIPPKLAKRNTRGAVLFKCCRVVFNEETNKLELPEGEEVGTEIHRSENDYDAEEYKNTILGLEEDEQSDLADFFTDEYEDSKKLEIIKKSVLKPTKNREERKSRINKYLSWFEKALAENQKTLVLDEPLNKADCEFLRGVFVPATPNQRTVNLTSLEMEKIQGYRVVLKILAESGLSDMDWNEGEEAWAE